MKVAKPKYGSGAMGRRLFVRVPQDLYDNCEARGVPSSVAREMIDEGLRGTVGHIKFVSGPYRRDLNLWLPDEIIDTIKALAERETERVGIKVDNGAIARWLIARGLGKASPETMRKAG